MGDGRIARLAVVAEIVRLGDKRIGRVGHTLVQKLAYLLQDALGVKLDYWFKMHLHGPYSADLWGDLTSLRDYDAISIDPDPTGYGYRITPGPALADVRGNHEAELRAVAPKIERLLKLLGHAPVRQLEILATAHFVNSSLKRRGKRADAESVTESVVALKPHLSSDEVDRGYRELVSAGLAS
jgi:hypothetical protein